MGETVQVALIAVLSPSLLAVLTAWIQRKAKREDWRRQDEVAARVVGAAVRTAKVAAKAETAAALLVESNAKVARAAEVASAETARRLADIAAQVVDVHTLVNSNLTASKQAELTARRALLANLLEREVRSPEDSEAIGAEEAAIAELATQVRDRLAATAQVAAQVRDRAAET